MISGFSLLSRLVISPPRDKRTTQNGYKRCPRSIKSSSTSIFCSRLLALDNLSAMMIAFTLRKLVGDAANLYAELVPQRRGQRGSDLHLLLTPPDSARKCKRPCMLRYLPTSLPSLRSCGELGGYTWAGLAKMFSRVHTKQKDTSGSDLGQSQFSRAS